MPRPSPSAFLRSTVLRSAVLLPALCGFSLIALPGCETEVAEGPTGAYVEDPDEPRPPSDFAGGAPTD